MRPIIVYVAVSLDGYLADSQGGVGWLDPFNSDAALAAVNRFIETVDTVIMGWKTYHQLVNELSPKMWPYETLMTYVITHRMTADQSTIRFTNQLIATLQGLRQQEGKSVWICGGSDIIHQLQKAQLIDEYQITIVPIFLGQGIRLFNQFDIPHFLLFKGMEKISDQLITITYKTKK